MNEVIDTLVAARLMRKAPLTQAVSFVNHRFNEYFLVSRWLSAERPIPYESIPTDSRFRDALVLYAEVADDDSAVRLAEYCWSDLRTPMRSVYSLRFLTEAFRARQEPVASFRDSLGKLVLDILNRDDDILSRKVAVESAGLLSAKASEAVFLKTLSTGNNWITDTAFAACRFQQRLSKRVEYALFNLIAGRGQLRIMLPDRYFRFVVGIADALNGLRRRFNALSVDVGRAWLSD